MDALTRKLVVSGYYDNEYDEFVGSETQGPACVNPADNALTNPRCWDAVTNSELAWSHRDEDDGSILKRWNQPEDVLDELQAIDEADERAVWVERMTAFRRAELHRLLTAYFGTERYTERQLVLKWEQRNGKWTPAEQQNVLVWISTRVEEKGSMLSGFASCAGTIRQRLARRRTPEPAHFH